MVRRREDIPLEEQIGLLGERIAVLSEQEQSLRTRAALSRGIHLDAAATPAGLAQRLSGLQSESLQAQHRNAQISRFCDEWRAWVRRTSRESDTNMAFKRRSYLEAAEAMLPLWTVVANRHMAMAVAGLRTQVDSLKLQRAEAVRNIERSRLLGSELQELQTELQQQQQMLPGMYREIAHDTLRPPPEPPPAMPTLAQMPLFGKSSADSSRFGVSSSVALTGAAFSSLSAYRKDAVDAGGAAAAEAAAHAKAVTFATPLSRSGAAIALAPVSAHPVCSDGSPTGPQPVSSGMFTKLDTTPTRTPGKPVKDELTGTMEIPCAPSARPNESGTILSGPSVPVDQDTVPRDASASVHIPSLTLGAAVCPLQLGQSDVALADIVCSDELKGCSDQPRIAQPSLADVNLGSIVSHSASALQCSSDTTPDKSILQVEQKQQLSAYKQRVRESSNDSVSEDSPSSQVLAGQAKGRAKSGKFPFVSACKTKSMGTSQKANAASGLLSRIRSDPSWALAAESEDEIGQATLISVDSGPMTIKILSPFIVSF